MFRLIRFFAKKQPEYVQVALDTVPGNEAIVTIDATDYEVIFFNVLYEPQLIGIVFPEFEVTPESMAGVSCLNIKNGTIRFDLTYNANIRTSSGNIFLCTVNDAAIRTGLFGKRYLQRFYERALVKKKYVIGTLDISVYRKLIAFFYYPKPVFLVCTATTENTNAFPVDTCRKVWDHYIFGARRSNNIIGGCAVGDVIIIGDADFSKRDMIYQLGKFRVAQDEIKFRTDTGTGIPVPETVSGYEAARIVQIMEYATQNVYIAEVVSERTVVNDAPALAHIHKFWLTSEKMRRRYSVV
ncbi:hypothetical protein HYN48_05040 [Flavobacterium magnum]|uniref:Uncharacterized protein n=1 Tax=Flavobacterium magnum TaxID=2162713 RepID=A0A2S0RCN2_9FLAO|nr:hypothetical protein [Flavobacterium magnum]AWA29503.1 hypothetical protein HYN48_05040 [Flavobacterium magnum]